MLNSRPKPIEKYYCFLQKTFNFKARVKVYEVNFNNPPWKLILRQRIRFCFVFFAEAINNILVSAIPIIIGWIFATQNYNFFYYLCAGLIFSYLLNIFIFYHYCILITSLSQSIFLSATKFFLVVDPVFHNTRSSGQIIAKINRGTDSFESVFDTILFDFMGTILGILTVSISIISLDLKAGIIALVFIVLISTIATLSNLARTSITSKKLIEADDSFKATALETIQQVNYIRSGFASEEQINKLQSLTALNQSSIATHRYTGMFTNTLIRIIFGMSFIVFGYQILVLINQSTLNPAFGLAILTAYINVSNRAIMFGRIFERFSDRLINVKDLFNFIKNYGQQSFPVLIKDLNNKKYV
jgi:ABC-type multidrug transport system fused ATPase/permease subunit